MRTAIKTTIMIAAFAAIVALDIGVAHWSSTKRVTEIAPTLGIERQFAIRFCYRQYTNQTDVSRCLLQNANLAPGESP